ncbi:phage prohead protease, HK97 family protein [Erythrobacter sp. NAP1]|uniref:HK97 family phage prohead protease n=1 Tax=Erythrobacter sp. NAP1 TaxID=237727 RepID=UPI000068783D|nr:HK97 family phage prohead protease [Erythrobacter sp. NAP1]EAQ28339.1 phage prohead protease, HK97 family protein [Erythrobacter sp. NAP1]
MTQAVVPHAPLRFAGYAGLFDIPDADRDTIRRGAFAESLRQASKPLPLLWQHRANQQIGEIERIEEDLRGLKVIARIERLQSRAASMLAARQVSGLSFGYRAREARHTSAGRELLSIDLFEVSLVTHPLQHGARVHFVA